jgi:hypothetical protein
MEGWLLGAILGRSLLLLNLTCPLETGLVLLGMPQHQDGEAPTLSLESWRLQTDGMFWNQMLLQALFQATSGGGLLHAPMLHTVQYQTLGMLGH